MKKSLELIIRPEEFDIPSILLNKASKLLGIPAANISAVIPKKNQLMPEQNFLYSGF